jgi:hypothetical protein
MELALVKPAVVPLPSFQKLYLTRRFITVFTGFLHWSLSWDRRIHFIPPHSISLRSILILSPPLHLCLHSGFVPWGFPTKILHAFLFPAMRATCPVHFILLNLTILIISGEEYKIWSSSLYRFLRHTRVLFNQSMSETKFHTHTKLQEKL